ncbi:hypothetical protein [Cellulomonas hominis]
MPAPALGEAIATLLETREEEHQVTTVMIKSTPEGARLHGLEFRVKSPASLARKIAQRAMTRRQSPAAAAASIADLVRYTAVTPDHDDLVATAVSMVDALEAQGFTVREAEHSYAPGNPYKGLHLQLVCPARPAADGQGEATAGMVVELQIHSEASQAIKDEIHLDYELERDAATDWSERAAARRRMVAASSVIAEPRGLAELEELGGAKLTVKVYPDPYEHEEDR